MFVQDNLQKLKDVFDANLPKTNFFTMLIQVVTVSVVWLPTAGRKAGTRI